MTALIRRLLTTRDDVELYLRNPAALNIAVGELQLNNGMALPVLAHYIPVPSPVDCTGNQAHAVHDMRYIV